MKFIHEKSIIGGGIWLVVLPYTGLPSSWKTVLTIVTGLVFLYSGLLQYKKAKAVSREVGMETKAQTFTEVA
jgi:hypothetical protein